MNQISTTNLEPDYSINMSDHYQKNEYSPGLDFYLYESCRRRKKKFNKKYAYIIDVCHVEKPTNHKKKGWWYLVKVIHGTPRNKVITYRELHEKQISEILEHQ